MRIRTTVVTNGRLGVQRQRLEAARAGAHGRTVTTVEGLACRLAGGFVRPIDPDMLRATLDAVHGGLYLGSLERIKALPGFIDAAAGTLRKAWRAAVDLSAMAADHPRIAEVARLEASVLAALPPGAMRSSDIAAAARGRLRHAAAVCGPVRITGVADLPPCWRALVNDLAAHVPVTWVAPAGRAPDWLAPAVAVEATPAVSPEVAVVSAATARHEAVEAMRWVRALLAGGVDAADIAIGAVSPGDYDDAVAALAADASIPVHIAHGVPAVATRDGQAAAALAELVVRGLSQGAVRRLAALAPEAFGAVPDGWRALRRDLALRSVDAWRTHLALIAAPADTLVAILERLAAGPAGAAAAADLLAGRARTIFERALAAGPAASLDLTLGSLRLPDTVDPAVSVVFAPALDLLAAPRPFVRLLGLNSSRWPRAAGEDRLLSDHILPSRLLEPVTLPAADRLAFALVSETTGKALVLSHARRDADGRRLGRSVLLPAGAPETYLLGARAPEHAFSETDRLTGRAGDVAATEQAKAALACWRNWNSREITAHDGAVRSDHPLLAAILSRTQSANSLKLLLRNPLGFVHRYALGLKPPETEEEPLTLDALAFGKLVHRVGELAVADLSPSGIAAAVETAAAEWPREAGLPPHVIWQRTLARAGEMVAAAAALAPPGPGARSYSEVPFGADAPLPGAAAPWPADQPVTIAGTPFKVRGTIDRVDLAPDGSVDVWDYKTGRAVKEDVVLGGGAELQRCIYAFAVRAMLGNVPVRASLVYPKDDVVRTLADPAATLATLAGHLADAAAAVLGRGGSLGPGTGDMYDDLAFALPASATYTDRKMAAAAAWFGDAATIWEAP